MDGDDALEAVKDDQLWRAAAAGNAEAFGELFVRYANAVNAYCFRRTASCSAAEDLVSVVFLEAWRCRTSLTVEEGSALPLLYGIARRVTSRYHRSLGRYRAALRRLPPALHEPDPALDVADRVDAERRMAATRELLTALPHGERDVVELCVFGGLDYAAAALALGVPVGTVRSRLSRARARMSVLESDRGLSPVIAHLYRSETR